MIDRDEIITLPRSVVEQALEHLTCPVDEPVAWLFQHEETGLTELVDVQQVEWGFEKNNPRWQKIGPVYTHPHPPRQPLTDAQINDHRLALPYDGEDLPDPWAFKQGVRAAERAHGIGDDA